MRYIDMCVFQVRLTNSMELKLLHSIAVKNKVDAVTFYLDSNNMYIAFESYLTGAVVTHKVSADISAIFVRDVDNNVYNTSIDNRRYITNEADDASTDSTPSRPLERVLSGLTDKTYVRFCATTNILKAMSLYTKNDIFVSVEDTSVVISDSTTFLTFGKVRTFSEIEDYMIPFVDVSWDPLDLDGISTIAKALLKTRDTVYKMYIALEGNKIYSHNTYFLIEQRGPDVSGKYVLPYTTIETLRMFQTKSKAYISKKANTLIIMSSNIYISWSLSEQTEDSENLMSILHQDNFIRIASVKQREWDKILLLKDYSDVDSDQDINVTLESNTLTATKDKNRTTIQADTSTNSISFKVGIDSLMIAKDLVGQRALLYIDGTGKDKVLVFYNVIMVVVPLADLKINSLSNYQKYLSQVTQAAREEDMQKKIAKFSEKLAEDDHDYGLGLVFNEDGDGFADFDFDLSLNSDFDLSLDSDSKLHSSENDIDLASLDVSIPPVSFAQPPIFNISAQPSESQETNTNKANGEDS